MKALISFLKDENYSQKHLNTMINPFNSNVVNVLHYFVMNLSVISKFANEFLNEWNALDSVKVIFNVIKLKPQIEISCFYIITNICDDRQIETLTEFNSILEQYREIIKRSANDFNMNKFNRQDRLIEYNDEIKMLPSHGIKFKTDIITSISGVLKSLYRLSINEKIKNSIYYDHKIKDDLKVIMLKGNEYETMFSLDLFIQMTFNQKIAEDLAKDQEILTFINAENKNEKIKKKIESIKWNLSKKEVKIESDQKQSNDKHIMISYNTSNREIVLKIKEKLESYGYRIWIDINDIHGSSLDSMANAIENSFVVLICISERYRESINCQAEAQYAFKIKKPIIPLILQKGYENVSGWLGILMGDKIFINFTKYELEECFKRLKNEIEAKKEKPKLNNLNENVIQVKTDDVILEKPRSKAESMNETDCKSWFETNKIDPLILASFGGSCNGQILKQLWEIKQRDPQFYDQSLKAISNISIFSIVKYSAALEELFKK
jgi:hypothetical protein